MATIAAILRWFADRWAWLLTWLLAPFVLLYQLWTELTAVLVAGLATATDWVQDMAAALSTDSSAFAGYLKYANSMFPLTETLALASLWLGLKVITVVVRLVKGVIPTYG